MEERAGIFGLETEYPLVFLPEEAAEPAGLRIPSPPFPLLERVLFESLLAGRKSAPSSGLKGGRFLQNGGLVHMEIYVRTQADTPVLEAATPECRSPWDLLAYARAYDDILEETSRRSRAALLEHGYRGKIAFGKNNLDARGAGVGCHENYLVHHELARREKALILLVGPFVLAAFLPAFFVLFLALLVAALALVAGRILGPLGSRLWERIVDWIGARPRLSGWSRAVYYIATNLLLYPGIRAYSTLLRAVAIRPFIRELTPFLVTRQILTGTGSLNFKRGVYELSQRPELTRSVGGIVMFGRKKTVFDLKSFLFDPLSLFRPTKRMTVAVGDSNLSDVPSFLKIGATALVIEMIEAGFSFGRLTLHRPIRALRRISREGPWKVLTLRSGETLTAIEIQRRFLLEAKAFFEGRPEGRLRHSEILRLWEESLGRLGDRPASLSDRLDWVAKKSLLDQAVLAQTNWKVFFAWGRIFEAAGLARSAGAKSLADLLRRSRLLRRRRILRLVERQALDAGDFTPLRDLYFQARKIDIRYHELGGSGYQRALEGEGLIRRLVSVEEVEKATREPPQDTRARVRGFYVQNAREPHALQVNWHEIELLRPSRHIPLPDPFSFRLPLE